MNRKLLYLFALGMVSGTLIMAGCSNKSTRAAAAAEGFSLAEARVVETPEAREQVEICHQSLTLFLKRDYDQLEALAARYRSSEEQYADGTWKLLSFYGGLESGITNNTEAGWVERKQQLQEWLDARPASVTARVALGNFLISYAWKARGDDWAGNVKDKDWPVFFSRLQEADAILQAAETLPEKCPCCLGFRLQAAMGLQTDRAEYDTLFQQAVKTEPDYEFYYKSRAIFLLPRWYGTEGEWVKDLTASANSVGGDPGDMLYAQVVWEVQYYGGGLDNIFEENPALSWDRLDRGFGVILKYYPTSLAAKSERAHLAALAGDQDKAREYLAQTKGQVDLTIWDAKTNFDRFYNWANGQ